MQRKTTQPVTQQPARAPHAPKGPTPIDPRDFKLVAGGAPKGGWSADCLSSTLAPKGGW